MIRSTPSAWPGSCAGICSPPSGSPRRLWARRGNWCATASRGCGSGRPSAIGSSPCGRAATSGRPAPRVGWPKRGQHELRALPLAASPATIREDCLALLPVLDAQIRRLDQEVVARWGDDPRVQRLTTIPGIGPFIAIVLVLELGDIQRFPSAKHLASYIGLTPRIRASADHVRTGHITKEGHRLLRWVLVLAATQAARRPGPLRAWVRALQQRKGRKTARVALARRLAEMVYHCGKDELEYWTMLRRGVVRG